MVKDAYIYKWYKRLKIKPNRLIDQLQLTNYFIVLYFLYPIVDFNIKVTQRIKNKRPSFHKKAAY